MIEYVINEDLVKKIYRSVEKYTGLNVSNETLTRKGFQTKNLIKLFDINLLKEIFPDKDIHKDIFHIHYIKYSKGGYQIEHDHNTSEKKSFIIYLNDADGPTVLKEPINKKVSPKKGKVIIFDSKITHYAEKSYKEKEVLVGSIGKTWGWRN